MIAEDKVLVVDIDGTLCPEKPAGVAYADLPVEPRLRGRLTALKAEGWHIILQTARGMRSNGGNTGAVTVNVLPVLTAWLARHDIPFDELHVGKPWAGRRGYYIDDRAVRPREFLDHSFEELDAMIRNDRLASPATGDDIPDPETAR